MDNNPTNVRKLKSGSEILKAKQELLKKSEAMASELIKREVVKAEEVIKVALDDLKGEPLEINEQIFFNHYLKFFVRGGHSKEDVELFEANWIAGCKGQQDRPVSIVTMKGDLIGIMPPMDSGFRESYVLGEDGTADMQLIASAAQNDSLLDPIGASSLLKKGIRFKTQEVKGAMQNRDPYREGLENIYRYFQVTDDGRIPGLDFVTGDEASAAAKLPDLASSPTPKDDTWGDSGDFWDESNPNVIWSATEVETPVVTGSLRHSESLSQAPKQSKENDYTERGGKVEGGEIALHLQDQSTVIDDTEDDPEEWL